MGKWLAKFSVAMPEPRTDTADIVPTLPALSALSVPHRAIPAKTMAGPLLQPGWRIVYRDHLWRLAGGSDDPEHGTVSACGQDVVTLTDGQMIPLSLIRSVAAMDCTGRIMGAWTVREHGLDGEGRSKTEEKGA